MFIVKLFIKKKSHFHFLQSSQNIKIPTLLIPFHSNQRLLIYSHGNAEDLQCGLEDFGEFLSRQLQCSILFYEYPGYLQTTVGDSNERPQPSEEFAYGAIEAAFDFATKTKNFKPENIYLLGKSLGSGPSTHLAEQCSKNSIPLAGLVLQSPIASAVRVVFPNAFVTWPIDIFVNCNKIGNVTCPITLIHGTDDEVVPLSNCELLEGKSGASLQSTLYIKNAGHKY